MSANLPASSGAKIPSPRRLKNEAKKLRRQDGEVNPARSPRSGCNCSWLALIQSSRARVA